MKKLIGNIYIVSLGICFLTAGIEFFTDRQMVIYFSYGVIVPLVVLFFKTLDKRHVDIAELLIFGIILINAPASLWWHEMGFQYDRFLHFGVAALAFPLLMILMTFLGIDKKLDNKKSFVALAVVISLAGLFLFEGYQYTMDQIFGTQLFYDASQRIAIDFWEDVVFGALGILLSLFVLKRNKVLRDRFGVFS